MTLSRREMHMRRNTNNNLKSQNRSHALHPDSVVDLIGGDTGDNSLAQNCSRLLNYGSLPNLVEIGRIPSSILSTSILLHLICFTSTFLFLYHASRRYCLYRHSLLDSLLEVYYVCDVSRIMSTVDLKDGGGRGMVPATDESAVQTAASSPTGRPPRKGIERNTGIIEQEEEKQSIWRRIYTTLTWTPPNCRWDPDKPPQFSMSSTSLCEISCHSSV